MAPLAEHIKFIGDIVESQQTYARAAGLIEVVSVSKLFDFAITLVAPHNLAAIEIKRELDEDITLEVDRQKVVQILSNLVKNGLEAHAGHPQESPTIWLSSKRKGATTAQLSVRDNGAGITKESQAKLFSFGYTTKQTGHGFGLHSCSNDAISMGGSLSARSDGVGQGAEFVLELPIRPDANESK
ncbi:MAG: sensor histidine kinase [Planctomycetaceae bacterium]